MVRKSHHYVAAAAINPPMLINNWFRLAMLPDDCEFPFSVPATSATLATGPPDGYIEVL